MFWIQLRKASLVFIVLTLLTGVIYPLIVSGIGQFFFHSQAEGSLIVTPDGKVLGSTLIGQEFNDPKYFWGRISATTPLYNAASSSGSNIGPLNPALLDEIKQRVTALKAADPDNNTPIPVDLVTSSASGLDPHISLAAAQYQLGRVAKVRGMDIQTVQRLIDQNTQGRFLNFLGEPVVNVLAVNLALDKINYKP